MKKFYSLITIALLITGPASLAQNLVAVRHNDTVTFYTTLSSALTGASDGDTVYIPGGTYDAITISKKLHLIGVGHHPDSTDATSRTYIKGITIGTGCSGGSLTGIFLSLYYCITFNSNLNGYTISRCYIPNFIIGSNPVPTLVNLSFLENQIGAMTMNYITYSGFYLSNNIITYQLHLYGVKNCVIKNNVFLSNSYASYFSNSLVENNLFGYFVLNNASNCIFHNNVNGGINGADNAGNQGSGNYLNQGALSAFFVSYDPATITLSNIYQANFHLVPGSPYLNAGRDGTDIGIYGGAYPWKDGSIPFNPHIQRINISPVTNSSGNLDVNIQVEAQER